jgi:hypothetical protein
MRKTVSKFLIALSKLLFTVMAMTLFYPVLGVITCEPITSLCQLLEVGSLVGEILMHGVHILSILVISFLAGLLFPRDRWIVRPAAIISISLVFFFDIRAGIYASRNIAHFPLFSFIRSLIIPFIFIILLTYWLSELLHHSGEILRGRPKAEA